MALAQRHERARAIAERAGCEMLVTGDPGTVWWLTGVEVEIETGPSPFAPGPIAVLAPDKPACVIVSSDDAPAKAPDGVHVLEYEGFTAGPLVGPALAQALLREVVRGRTVAGEPISTPGSLWPGGVDVASELMHARAVKDADEVEALRRAVAAADVGQARLRELDLVGMTEVDVLGEVRLRIEAFTGVRTPLLADLVSGSRTLEMGGSPKSRVIRPGDMVLCDLAPRVGGVWGDSCATVVAGGSPSAEQHRAHDEVLGALNRFEEAAMQTAADSGELDAIVRRDLPYPHHSGHGLGGSYHEQPRIVPGARTTLQPGMVVAVEPGWYVDEVGLRLEHVFLLEENGAVDLSGHSLAL